MIQIPKSPLRLVFFRLLVLSTLLLIGTQGIGQTKQPTFEGKVQFAINFEVGEGLDKSLLDMMPKINNIDFYFKGNKSRIITDVKPGMVKEILTIPNAKGGMEKYSLDRKRKLAIRMTEKIDKAAAKIDTKPQIEKTKLTKTIAGYACTLYTGEQKDPSTGQMVKINTWVTKDLDIRLPKDESNPLFTDGVDGFPVLMELDMVMFKMTLTVNKVEKVVLPAESFVIPSDFTKRDFNHKINGTED
jgi:hypothetical protein